MGLSRDEIRELANILNARAGLGRSERPKLRLVTPPSPKLLDPIFRDAHIKRVLHLQRAYRLQWLVDQETFNVASLSCLEDCDLIRLVALLERARECIADGVSLEDAGLVRSVGQRHDSDVLPPSRKMVQQAEIAEMAVERMRKVGQIKSENRADEAPF